MEKEGGRLERRTEERDGGEGRKKGSCRKEGGFAEQEEKGGAAARRLCRAQAAWVQNPAPHLRMQTASTQPEPSRNWGAAAAARAVGYGAGHQNVLSAMHTGARQQATSATKVIVAELGPVSTKSKHQQAKVGAPLSFQHLFQIQLSPTFHRPSLIPSTF